MFVHTNTLRPDMLFGSDLGRLRSSSLTFLVCVRDWFLAGIGPLTARQDEYMSKHWDHRSLPLLQVVQSVGIDERLSAQWPLLGFVGNLTVENLVLLPPPCNHAREIHGDAANTVRRANSNGQWMLTRISIQGHEFASRLDQMSHQSCTTCRT